MKKFLVLGLIGFLLPYNSYAKSPNRANKNSSYLYKSFDINTKKLIPNFKGVNIQELYNELSTRDIISEKNEFETTKQFQNRLAKEKKSTIIGLLDNKSIFAFTGEDNSYNLDLNYNADLQKLKLKLNLNDVYGDFYGNKSINLKTIRSSRYYKATNGFGAKLDVEEVSITKYKLNTLNIKSFIKEGDENSLENISLTSDKAKNFKDSNALKLLFISKLSDPALHSDFTRIEPTINKPTDYMYLDYYINVNLQEIWLYDKNTGNILKKIKSQTESDSNNSKPEIFKNILGFNQIDFNDKNKQNFESLKSEDLILDQIKLNSLQINTSLGDLNINDLEYKTNKNNLMFKINLYNPNKKNINKVSFKVSLEHNNIPISDKHCIINSYNLMSKENKIIGCYIKNIPDITSLTTLVISENF